MILTEKYLKEPKITLVGAGPGDPDLITLKAIKAIKAADVIIYDALVSEELLEYAPAHAPRVFVGKRSGDDTFSQDAVNKLMVDYALNYGHVVRLKGGDPFVFANGYQEVEIAASYSIPSEVIPGLSSAISVPALLGIPVTHRGLSESFWVVNGTTATGELSEELALAAQSKATVIVTNGISKLEEIAAIFKQHGKSRLPVAVISQGSMAGEKIVVGNVTTINEAVQDQKLVSPALIVLGDVVGLHAKFQPIKHFYQQLAEEVY